MTATKTITIAGKSYAATPYNVAYAARVSAATKGRSQAGKRPATAARPAGRPAPGTSLAQNLSRTITGAAGQGPQVASPLGLSVPFLAPPKFGVFAPGSHAGRNQGSRSPGFTIGTYAGPGKPAPSKPTNRSTSGKPATTPPAQPGYGIPPGLSVNTGTGITLNGRPVLGRGGGLGGPSVPARPMDTRGKPASRPVVTGGGIPVTTGGIGTNIGGGNRPGSPHGGTATAKGKPKPAGKPAKPSKPGVTGGGVPVKGGDITGSIIGTAAKGAAIAGGAAAASTGPGSRALGNIGKGIGAGLGGAVGGALKAGGTSMWLLLLIGVAVYAVARRAV